MFTTPTALRTIKRVDSKSEFLRQCDLFRYRGALIVADDNPVKAGL